VELFETINAEITWEMSVSEVTLTIYETLITSVTDYIDIDISVMVEDYVFIILSSSGINYFLMHV
jgi:hypothetical protein